MTARADNENLKSFDAYADENGQNMGQDSPVDVANAARLQRALAGDPSGEAETARLASGRKSENADEATAAEVPAENLRRISDPSTGPDEASDAVRRATASLGESD